MIVEKITVLAASALACVGVSVLADGIQLETPYVLGILGGAGSVIYFLFRMNDAGHKREIASLSTTNALLREEQAKQQVRDEKEREHELKDMESRKKSFENLAIEAIKSAKQTSDFYRAKNGLPPSILVADVIPESSSPSTEKQREESRIATMRASLVAIQLAEGQPPREEPEHAVEGLDKLKEKVEAIPAKTVDLAVAKLKDEKGK